MPSIDLATLTHHVRAILADPYMEAPHIGVPTLDRALAIFAQYQCAGMALPAPRLNFWETPPVVAHADRS